MRALSQAGDELKTSGVTGAGEKFPVPLYRASGPSRLARTWGYSSMVLRRGLLLSVDRLLDAATSAKRDHRLQTVDEDFRLVCVKGRDELVKVPPNEPQVVLQPRSLALILIEPIPSSAGTFSSINLC